MSACCCWKKPHQKWFMPCLCDDVNKLADRREGTVRNSVSPSRLFSSLPRNPADPRKSAEERRIVKKPLAGWHMFQDFARPNCEEQGGCSHENETKQWIKGTNRWYLKCPVSWDNRKYSFQLFVVVSYTCSVSHQLVSPSLAQCYSNLALF